MKFTVKIGNGETKTFDTHEGATKYFIENWNYGETYEFRKIDSKGVEFAY